MSLIPEFARAQELFKGQQEYVSKVAKSVKEACTLVDSGFEYVTGEYRDGGKIFRKPKFLACIPLDKPP